MFIHCTDGGMIFFRNHADRKHFGNGTGIGNGCHPCAGTSPQSSLHLIVMQEDSAPAGGRCQPFAQKSHDTVKCRTFQIPVRCGPPTEREEFVGTPFLTRHFSDDLLSQHVHRRDGNGNHVEIPLSDRSDHRHTFNQFIARQCKQPALRRQSQRVA